MCVRLSCDGLRCQRALLALARSVTQRRHMGAKLLWPVEPLRFLDATATLRDRRNPKVGCVLSFFYAAGMITQILVQTPLEKGATNLHPKTARTAYGILLKLKDDWTQKGRPVTQTN